MALPWVLAWTLVSLGALLHVVAASSYQGNDCEAPVEDDLSLMQTNFHATLARAADRTAMVEGGSQTPGETPEVVRSSAVASQPVAASSVWIALMDLLSTNIEPLLPPNRSVTVAMNKMVSAPGYNLTDRFVTALAYFNTTCPQGTPMRLMDCSRAAELVKAIIPISMKPNVTPFSTEIQYAFQLDWLMWNPGPPSSIWILDTDDNGAVDEHELNKTLPLQKMRDAVRSTWSYLDADGNNATTRHEIYDFIRAVILVRQFVPELDITHPTASTAELVKKAEIYKRMRSRHSGRPIISPSKIAYLFLIFFLSIVVWIGLSSLLPNYK